VETLERGAFDLTVEPLDTTDAVREDLLALLRLVAEDLNDGLIGIGGGTARGYGSVQVGIDDLPPLPAARARLATIIATHPIGGPHP
jgi:hypothetical protein